MKKIIENKFVVISCLVILIYCLSILIEKRINPQIDFNFKLFSPYYLIYSLVIPILIIVPIKLMPSCWYTKFVLQRTKTLNKIVVISTGIILVWFILWYAMSGVGKLMSNSLKTTEAEAAAITFIKNDSTVKTKIGHIDSIEVVSYSISEREARYYFILQGKDSSINVEISLIHNQNWLIDSLLIK